MGTTAFLLNFIPILGPLFGVGIFALVGMLSFDSLWWALLPPVLYFCIHLVEGETLTPMLLARRFTLNAPGHVRTTVSNAFENCVLQQAFFHAPEYVTISAATARTQLTSSTKRTGLPKRPPLASTAVSTT
jgi:hypothetical protein